MDKNTVVGMLLMALVLFGFMYCNRPDSSEEKKQNDTTEKVEPPTKDEVNQIAIAQMEQPGYENKLIQLVETRGKDVNGVKTLAVGNTELRVAQDVETKHLEGFVTVGTQQVDVATALNLADTINISKDQRANVANKLATIQNDFNTYQDFYDLKYAPAEKPFTVSNSKMSVTFNPKGGRIETVTLKDYNNETEGRLNDKVEVFNSHNGKGYSFELNLGDRAIHTRDLTFKRMPSKDKNDVIMRLELSGDRWMDFVYTIVPDEYIVRLNVRQHNMDQNAIQPNVTSMKFNWTMDVERNEEGRSFEERNSTVYYKMIGESPDKLDSDKKESEKVNNVKWVAFKNQFFSAIVIPRESFSAASVESTPIARDSQLGKNYVKTMDLEGTLRYSPGSEKAFSLDFYLGPNSYQGLKAVNDIINADGDEDLELQKVIPLGWGIFGWINRILVIPLFNLLGSFIGSYGIIILILTIIIKIILFPFTYKSYMSQAKMRVLAPEIKEINEKYPGQENAMKRQQETMKLYSRAGASPFSGCLPMLLQLPVLIALFSFFPSAIELRGQSFLWAHDLAAPDYICTLPFSIPFYGDRVSLFCLLMTITNIVYSRISMASNPSAGMGGMKWMTYLMPILFLFFFNDYASGLSYYYFVSLLITIGQTYICRKIVSEDKVRKQMEENANKPRKKKGFMARLEAAQKRQEAMMREQAKQRAKRRR